MSYASEVLADSPSLYLRLGETSGTSAADSSGNGRTGTYVNTPTLGVAGALASDTDKAVAFTAAQSEMVTVPYFADLDATSWTLEAWVKTTGANQAVVSRSGDSNEPYALSVGASGNPTVVIKYSGSTGPNYTGSAVINDGHWHHVVAVRDGTIGAATDLWIYVDGALDSSFDSFTPKTGSSFDFRVGSRGTSLYIDGSVDEVAFYPAALSSTRVAAHYAAGTAIPPPSGSFAATLPKPTVALSGTYRDVGSFAATLPKPTASLTGTYQAPPTGTFAATLPKVTAALSGDYTPPVTPTGDLHATLPKPTVALVGEYHQHETGTFDAVLPFPTVALTGTYIARETGTFAATLPVPDVAFTGDYAEPPHPTGLLHPTLLLPVVAFTGTYTGPVGTDTSNAFDGLDLVCLAHVTLTRPPAPVPPRIVLGEKYDKAVPYPVPVMVNGRPS